MKWKLSLRLLLCETNSRNVDGLQHFKAGCYKLSNMDVLHTCSTQQHHQYLTGWEISPLLFLSYGGEQTPQIVITSPSFYPVTVVFCDVTMTFGHRAAVILESRWKFVTKFKKEEKKNHSVPEIVFTRIRKMERQPHEHKSGIEVQKYTKTHRNQKQHLTAGQAVCSVFA